MSITLPPIYRDCRRLLLHTEQVVMRFSRYHKYTVGADLRRQAMALMRGVHQAVYDRPNQASLVQALVWRVDDYKITLQLAIDVGAFTHTAHGQQAKTGPGFAAFETAAQLAGQIGFVSYQFLVFSFELAAFSTEMVVFSYWYSATNDSKLITKNLILITNDSKLITKNSQLTAHNPPGKCHVIQKSGSLEAIGTFECATVPVDVGLAGLWFSRSNHPLRFVDCQQYCRRLRSRRAQGGGAVFEVCQRLGRRTGNPDLCRNGSRLYRPRPRQAVGFGSQGTTGDAGRTSKNSQLITLLTLRAGRWQGHRTESFGKGSHAAVDRLQNFMRQRENMPGAGGGWLLQLDIHNYFNSIHRPTLYALLVQRIAQQEGRGLLPARHALALRSLCHKLLVQRTLEQVRDPQAAARLPAHKRLCHAAPGCGLPVGNLTSQFFANVYLNALDQFVKHTLKVRHYVRYVDDFVLLGDSPAQLLAWKVQIAAFLQQHLALKLRDDARLQPCTRGVDFLGYEVFSHHRRVRKRVVRHCRAKLQAWYQQHERRGLRPSDIAQLQSLLGSYWGHFAHANSVRLRRQLFADMPWLSHFFNLGIDARLYLKAPSRWQSARRRAVRQFLKPEGDDE